MISFVYTILDETIFNVMRLYDIQRVESSAFEFQHDSGELDLLKQMELAVSLDVYRSLRVVQANPHSVSVLG